MKGKSDSNDISLAENEICKIFIQSRSATPTSALSAPAGLLFFCDIQNAVGKKRSLKLSFILHSVSYEQGIYYSGSHTHLTLMVLHHYYCRYRNITVIYNSKDKCILYALLLQ